MDIFIGNVPYDTTPDELERLLTRHGRVDRVHLPVDAAGQPRGFGFATMPVPAHAAAAIATLDGSRLKGRSLRVNEAAGGNARRPRQDRRLDIANVSATNRGRLRDTESSRNPPKSPVPPRPTGRPRPMGAAVTRVRAHTRGAMLAAATFAAVLPGSVSQRPTCISFHLPEAGPAHPWRAIGCATRPSSSLSERFSRSRSLPTAPASRGYSPPTAHLPSKAWTASSPHSPRNSIDACPVLVEIWRWSSAGMRAGGPRSQGSR